MKLLYVPFVLILFIHSSVIRAQNFTLSTQVIDAPCGLCEGKIDLTVTGGTSPYVYAWSNSSTTQDLSGVSPSVYGVTVNDANGCSATGSYTVQSPNVLNGATATGSPACSDDGKLVVNIPSVADASGPFKVK